MCLVLFTESNALLKVPIIIYLLKDILYSVFTVIATKLLATRLLATKVNIYYELKFLYFIKGTICNYSPLEGANSQQTKAYFDCRD